MKEIFNLKISPKIFVCAEPENNIKKHFETIISCSKCGEIITILKVPNSNYTVLSTMIHRKCLRCGRIHLDYKVSYK